MLNDEIKKKYNLKKYLKKDQNQPVLIFKVCEPNHESETNPIENKL